MPKPKIKLISRITHFFTHHPWLKAVALLLAVMVWFYVHNEIGKFNY